MESPDLNFILIPREVLGPRWLKEMSKTALEYNFVLSRTTRVPFKSPCDLVLQHQAQELYTVINGSFFRGFTCHS